MTRLEEINAETTVLKTKFESELAMYRTACFCDEKQACDLIRDRMHTLIDHMLDNVYLAQQLIKGEANG